MYKISLWKYIPFWLADKNFVGVWRLASGVWRQDFWLDIISAYYSKIFWRLAWRQVRRLAGVRPFIGYYD